MIGGAQEMSFSAPGISLDPAEVTLSSAELPAGSETLNTTVWVVTAAVSGTKKVTMCVRGSTPTCRSS